MTAVGGLAFLFWTPSMAGRTRSRRGADSFAMKELKLLRDGKLLDRGGIVEEKGVPNGGKN